MSLSHFLYVRFTGCSDRTLSPVADGVARSCLCWVPASVRLSAQRPSHRVPPALTRAWLEVDALMALRRILKEAAGLTGRGGSECSKPISAVVHQRREMFSLQLPLSWRPQESYFVPNASTEAAVAVQQAGSSWGGPASILAQASDCIHAVGMWLACPKSKVSPISVSARYRWQITQYEGSLLSASVQSVICKCMPDTATNPIQPASQHQ